MVFQHSTGWSWDFNVYSLNAQYLFHNGVYMEWLRPPLVPVILGFLQYVFPVKASEYVFIVLSSILFAYSVEKLSRTYGLKQEAFYILAFSPFVIFYANFNGTELLYLGFLTLFLTDFKSPRSGLWMGLAFLTRYTAFILIPLSLLQRDIRKTFKTLLTAFLTVLPWFIYNHIALGHPFASLSSNYALNAAERGLATAFDPLHIFLITAFSIPLALLYVKDLKLESEDYLMFAVSALIIFRQFATQVKELRYVIDLAVPAAFLGAKGLEKLEIDQRKILLVLTGVYLIGFGVLMVNYPLEDPGIYMEASNEVGDCQAVSDEWVHLSYAGTPSGPLRFQSAEEFKDEGYKVVNFSQGSYTVEGSECIERPYNTSYVESIGQLYGREIRYCEYLPVETCEVEEMFGRPFR
ncbi:MAG: ArnT family glycosyltransferase [Candidatus Nanohaloarchaea archaeon]